MSLVVLLLGPLVREGCVVNYSSFSQRLHLM
jgi:hypothetical protein